MSVGQISATNEPAPGHGYNEIATELRMEFESPVEVTAVNGTDPNAIPPPKDGPTLQGGGAGGAPPSREVTITFPSAIAPNGQVKVNVKTSDDKAIRGKYRFSCGKEYLHANAKDFMLGSDQKPTEPN